VLAVARPTPGDLPAFTTQRTCSVSGRALDPMASPVRVTSGDRATFLCCRGCLARMQAYPEKYLGAPGADPRTDGNHPR